MENIINGYNASGLSKELKTITTLDDAVKCQYHYGGKILCCSHQHRLRKNLLDEMLAKLKTVDLSKCVNFEDIYDTVDKHKVAGVGRLTIYDISLHIGYMLNPKVLPERLVYLNRGAMQGAKVLYDKGFLKNKPELTMDVEEFDFLKNLKQLNLDEHGIPQGATFAMLVEDFLCVKHKDFCSLNK